MTSKNLQIRTPATHALVTGGAGFIGSHLADHLLAQGHAVTVVDDLSTGRPENVAHLEGEERFRFVEEDVRTPGLLDELCAACDVAFHLAATVGVKHILQRPIHTIENNVLGTRAVLRAASRHGTKMVLTSTASIYGHNQKLPYTEEDVYCLGPTTQSRWGYAMSKGVGELLALAYHKERGLPVVVVRPFNTIGPRQTGAYGHVVPTFIGQALRDERLTIYGDGHQHRCFCDVRDVVQAYAGLAESEAAVGEVFNVGNDQEITILGLAELVLDAVDEVLGREDGRPLEERVTYVPYEEAYPEGFVEMTRRIPDTTKVRKAIGWRAEIGLGRTIREVVEAGSGEQA